MKRFLSAILLIAFVLAANSFLNAKTTAKTNIAKFSTYVLKQDGKAVDTGTGDRANGGNYSKIGNAYFVDIETIEYLPVFYLIYGNTAYKIIEPWSSEWWDYIEYCDGQLQDYNSAEKIVANEMISFDEKTKTITLPTYKGPIEINLTAIPTTSRYKVTWY